MQNNKKTPKSEALKKYIITLKKPYETPRKTRGSKYVESENTNRLI